MESDTSFDAAVARCTIQVIENYTQCLNYVKEKSKEQGKGFLLLRRPHLKEVFSSKDRAVNGAFVSISQLSAARPEDGEIIDMVLQSDLKKEQFVVLFSISLPDARVKAKAFLMTRKLSVLSLDDTLLCDGCKEGGPALSWCSGCNNAIYCSKECQKKCRPRHKLYCKSKPKE
jgi:hypothetical protein